MTDTRKTAFHYCDYRTCTGLCGFFFIGGLCPMLCLRVLEGYLKKMPKKERQ